MKIILAVALLFVGFVASAADYRTDNFLISARDPAMAKAVAEASEVWREKHSQEWLGQSLPKWQRPLVAWITVDSSMGGGVTAMTDRSDGSVSFAGKWRGSAQKIMDDVVPHEVLHAVFYSHFRQPLPRWADEGACGTVESEAAREHLKARLREYLLTGRGIAFNDMFAMTNYPLDVHPLYAQGNSLADFLIQHGGKQHFVAYVGDGLESGDWKQATVAYYGADLNKLQTTWLAWVKADCPDCQNAPRLDAFRGTGFAGVGVGRSGPRGGGFAGVGVGRFKYGNPHNEPIPPAPPTLPPDNPPPIAVTPERGPPGPAGPEGPQGPQGPAGPRGEPGSSAEVDDLLARIELLESKLQEPFLVEVANQGKVTQRGYVTPHGGLLRINLDPQQSATASK